MAEAGTRVPCLEIARQRAGARLAVGEGYVAVRSQQVDSITRKSRRTHLVAPARRVQCDAARLASVDDGRGGRSVDVHLPVERGEWGEIVVPAVGRREPDPRQPIAGVHPSSGAAAECAVTIFDRGLRNRAEHESAHPRKRERRWQDERQHVNADPARQRSIAGCQLECALGRGDQSLRESNALGYVSSKRGEAQPCTTAASFHPKLNASPSPVFMPWAPTGLWMFAASPSRNARPVRKCAATR